MSKAKLGDRVRVQYLGLLNSGKCTQQRRGRKVLEFVVGSAAVIPGISRGVLGMVEGEERRLTLQPDEAYGAVHSKLVKEIPRRRFPPHIELRVGKRLTSIGARTGRRRRVQILEVTPDKVVVDGNHPLAGKVLEIEIQLVSLVPCAIRTDDHLRCDFGGEG